VPGFTMQPCFPIPPNTAILAVEGRRTSSPGINAQPLPALLAFRKGGTAI